MPLYGFMRSETWGLKTITMTVVQQRTRSACRPSKALELAPVEAQIYPLKLINRSMLDCAHFHLLRIRVPKET